MAGHSRSKNGVASLAYVPAIHAFALADAVKTWMPGPRPGMTERVVQFDQTTLEAHAPGRRRLFGARNPGLLDDLAPARDLGLHEGLELVGRRRELRYRAVADQILLDVRIVHD